MLIMQTPKNHLFCNYFNIVKGYSFSQKWQALFYRSCNDGKIVMRRSYDKEKHDKNNQETIRRLIEYIKKMEEKNKQL